MSIISKLASSLNRRDEVPNQELAKEIILAQDKEAVRELIDNLSGKKDIQNDCIKVLYEVGEQAPDLIADHIEEFVSQLVSKNNRLQWGAMTALATITKERPKDVYDHLPAILDASGKGSVITKDNAVNILIKLCEIDEYSENAFDLLLEELMKSPANQLPMYAEKAFHIVNEKNKVSFINILNSRLGDIEKDTKRKRVEKVIKRLK